MSHNLNTYDESILFHEMFSFLSNSCYLSNFLYLFNSFIEIENNDFNFNMFIKDCKAVSYGFSQDIHKEFSDVGDSLYF